jgi:hypothetical protein
MAGTIRGLATCPRAHECKNIGWQTHPPGQPPSRSSDTSGLSAPPCALGPFLLMDGDGGWRGGVGALETRVRVVGQFEASWLGSLGRLGCLSVIRLPQSSACQRSLVEVRPTIPVCTLVGSVGLCVRLGLRGASNPWRSPAMRQILRGLMVVQVPSHEFAPAFRLDV